MTMDENIINLADFRYPVKASKLEPAFAGFLDAPLPIPLSSPNEDDFDALIRIRVESCRLLCANIYHSFKIAGGEEIGDGVRAAYEPLRIKLLKRFPSHANWLQPDTWLDAPPQSRGDNSTHAL
jgi:hypothetical protein